MLMARFGIFWRPLRMRHDRAMKVIEACFRLHNFCNAGKPPPRRILVADDDRTPSNSYRQVAAADPAPSRQGARHDLERSQTRFRLRKTIVAEQG